MCTGGVDNAAYLVFHSVLCTVRISLVVWIAVRWFVGWLTLTFIRLFAMNLDGMEGVAGYFFDLCISY